MPLGVEQVSNELGAFAKRIYDTGVIDQEQRLTITYDELPTKQWNIRGDGWYGDAHLKSSSSLKFTTPTEANPQDTVEVNQQFLIRRSEMQGIVTFTKDFLEALVGGAASFEDYTFKIEDLMRRQKKNLNQACYIGPSMVRALLTSSPAAATTFTVDNTQYLFVGMFIDIYNAAVISVNNVEVTNININTNTITVGTAITSTTGFQVYLHEENLTANKGPAGLPNQCDDGTDFAVTFENISRTTFPVWQGNRVDAASGALTNDLLQRGANLLYTQGGNDYMTEDYVNFVHPNSVRRYLQILLPQKRYMNASKYDSGMEKPNMLEWNGRPVVIDPDAGKNDWIMYNRANGGKVEVCPLSVDSTLGGTSMKWRAGYMQGVTVSYWNGNLGTNKPNSNLIIRNLITIT